MQRSTLEVNSKLHKKRTSIVIKAAPNSIKYVDLEVRFATSLAVNKRATKGNKKVHPTQNRLRPYAVSAGEKKARYSEKKSAVYSPNCRMAQATKAVSISDIRAAFKACSSGMTTVGGREL